LQAKILCNSTLKLINHSPFYAESEIIEMNGFVMKRRKTSVAPQAAIPAGPPANLLRTPYEPQETRGMSAGTSQRTPNVEEFELPPELYERLSQALHDLPENAAPVERLLALCGSVCDAKLDILKKAGDTEDAAVLDTVFKSFLESLKQAAESGSIQFAVPPSSGAVELGDEDLKVDLEARKAGLRNRLALLKKVRSRKECSLID
jgi:hypothetical protein